MKRNTPPRRDDGDSNKPGRKPGANPRSRKPDGEAPSSPREERPRRDGDDRPARRPSAPFGGRDERPRRDGDDRPARRPSAPFGGRDERPRRDNDDRPARRPSAPFGGRDERPRRDGDDRPARRPSAPFGGRDERPRRDGDDRRSSASFGGRDERPRRDNDDRRPSAPFGGREERPRRDGEESPIRRGPQYSMRDVRPRRNDSGDRSLNWDKKDAPERRPYSDRIGGDREDSGNRPRSFEGKPSGAAPKKPTGPSKGTKSDTPEREPDGTMRLNKYVANAGICSRRKADEFIANGQVTVNGEVVLEMGHRIRPEDVIAFKGKEVKPKENFVYILVNKPKNVITTASDERGRMTVMDLVRGATTERIYPVGRLDRHTTGLLLLTNDGDMALKLSHPSFKMKKVYYALLDKPLTPEDLEAIRNTVTLEDGPAPVVEVDYVDNLPGPEVGLEIHMGKNRVVRRIFEHLGYQVERLDRVLYGPLNKKDLPKGRWRHLTPNEIILLKHIV